MTVEISPVTDPADFPRLAEIRAKAFAGSRIDELCYPNTTVEDHVVSISRLMTKLMDDPKVAVWKATKDGEIVGLATWSVPHEYDAAEKEKEAKKKANETPEERLERLKERFPAGTNYLLADEFFSSLDLGIKEPHYRERWVAIAIAHSTSDTRSPRRRPWHSRRRPKDPTLRRRFCSPTMGQRASRQRRSRLLPRSDDCRNTALRTIRLRALPRPDPWRSRSIDGSVPDASTASSSPDSPQG